ncbi:MAG: hypothetical protein V3S01_06960 [Dehalococcoidia bacterium]
MSDARTRSETSPGREGTGSRDRKVAQRLADVNPARDPEVVAAKVEKTRSERGEDPRVPVKSRFQLAREARHIAILGYDPGPNLNAEEKSRVSQRHSIPPTQDEEQGETAVVSGFLVDSAGEE